MDRERRPHLELHYYAHLSKAAAVPLAVALIGFLLVKLQLL